MNWYRYADVDYSDDNIGPRIYLQCFPVVRETPRGVFLKIPYQPDKFVLAVARKRFAYPTLELAWDSYKIRKSRQAGWLRAKLAHVDAVRGLYDNDLPAPDLTDGRVIYDERNGPGMLNPLPKSLLGAGA